MGPLAVLVGLLVGPCPPLVYPLAHPPAEDADAWTLPAPLRRALRELPLREKIRMMSGEPLSLRSPDGTARAGRLARLADGTVMVAYTGLSALYVERLSCPEVPQADSVPGAPATPP